MAKFCRDFLGAINDKMTLAERMALKVLLPMPAKTSITKSIYAPLTEAIKRIEFWLERDGASRIILASPSLQELRRQNPHGIFNATLRKLIGPRKLVRGRRHYHELHMRLANWPNDAMNENVMPFILCVISGQADFRIGNYVLHCKVGDWVCVPGGVPKQDGSMPHFETDPAGRQCDVLWINPFYMGTEKARGVQCYICHSAGQEHFKNKEENCSIGSQFLAQLFNGIYDEILARNASEAVALLLRGALQLMRTEIAEGNTLFGGIQGLAGSGAAHDPIEEAKRYITANIWRPMTIQTVARHVLVSPSTLTRYFRERTGQTFVQYLNEQRVQLAAELLRETNYPISIIGEKVGLKYGQLRVLILKEYHCTPGELRAKMKTDKNN